MAPVVFKLLLALLYNNIKQGLPKCSYRSFGLSSIQSNSCCHANPQNLCLTLLSTIVGNNQHNQRSFHSPFTPKLKIDSWSPWCSCSNATVANKALDSRVLRHPRVVALCLIKMPCFRRPLRMTVRKRFPKKPGASRIARHRGVVFCKRNPNSLPTKTILMVNPPSRCRFRQSRCTVTPWR